MTPRERILAALERRPLDRPPFDVGGTDCTGIHLLPYRKLRQRLGLEDGPIGCGCLTQLIAEMDEEVRVALGTDVEVMPFAARETRIWQAPFGVAVRMPAAFDIRDREDGSSEVVDATGRVTLKRAAGAYYFDPHDAPLADLDEPHQLDDFTPLFERWDYPRVYDEPLEELGARARARYAATARAVTVPWRLHYLQSGQIMRGCEQFLIDLIAEQDMARGILDRLHAAYLRRIDDFFAAYSDAFDIVFLTDDLGSQQSGLISPALYREMIFPYTAELVARIKARGKKVVMHSCGAIADFIPFLIEMGVDGLNPVQVSARGMNPADLVRAYGRDITFWGGCCDTQQAMTRGPAAVRADVQRRMQEFGPDASLVFCQVHNIQYDVDPDSILALRDAYRECVPG